MHSLRAVHNLPFRSIGSLLLVVATCSVLGACASVRPGVRAQGATAPIVAPVATSDDLLFKLLTAQFALQRRQQENALSLLLGEPPGEIPRGRPLQEVIQSVTVPDSLPGALIARRPDVMRAQRELQASLARIGVAVANRLPTITVAGEYGAQRPQFNKLLSGQGDIYTVQAGLSFPLFTGGRLLNEQRAARARADESKAQYQQTVLVALSESADALAGVRLGRDQLVAQQTQARALAIAAGIAERRYASGVSSYLEVLTAEQSLFNAQLNLVQVEQQYLAATVQLYKALGGNWGSAGRSANASPSPGG